MRRPPYKLILAGAAAIWGGSFVVLKDALDAMPTSWLLGIRFMLAGIVMALVFARRLREHLDRRHMVAGLGLGLTGGIAYLIQNIGLSTTTPGHNAFLTATYCVMVPFIHWVVARVRPGFANVAAALLALGGVGVLSLEGGAFALGMGDVLTVVAAFWFAVQIEVMVHVARGRDVLSCTVIEFFVMGVLCLCHAIVFEPLPQLSVFADGEFLFELSYLVLLASCVCFMAQNVGQAHVPPSQASLLMSLESVFGVGFSVLIYHEPLTLQLFGGFAMVFGAVILSELFSPAQ